MGKKVKLRDLLSKEQLFMPCVWDCMSLKAAELSGFKAAVVGGSCFAWSHAGIPDLGMITIDEYKQGFERMTDTSPLSISKTVLAKHRLRYIFRPKRWSMREFRV